MPAAPHLVAVFMPYRLFCLVLCEKYNKTLRLLMHFCDGLAAARALRCKRGGEKRSRDLREVCQEGVLRGLACKPQRSIPSLV